MSAVTTHVLDTVSGRPASGVRVRLERVETGAPPPGVLAEATTDDDGRVRNLGPDRLEPGTYRLTFDTGAWFSARGIPAYYPQVSVAFSVTDDQHHHVPLLLSPFAYSTYRGS